MELAITGLVVLGKTFGAVLIADLLSGFFHWLEDTYGHEHWPLTGRFVTRPNVLHHHDPGHFTYHPWLVSSWVSMVIAAMGLGFAYGVGLLGWTTLVVAFVGINANQVHKWAHRPRREKSSAIVFLQATGVLQSPAHHAMHHRGAKNTSYCVVTNYLNPVLDRLRFWRSLEWAVCWVTGVRPRVDTSIKPTQWPTARPECTRRSCQRRLAADTRM